ncbi:phage baseplate assembly protein V [Erythrobacter donghaensis]|uniref:phage baseplate assembly protein V n=1 Tax=Erythrobacter donghaensis TaxID=267135 RepID=UPI000A38B184|nr:phage baseplate assembly protein V [Erythrobacter donghaensis]
MSGAYPGLYRGKVQNNIDPLMLGRLAVSVPGVPGASELSWALPCVPYAGSGVGGFSLPPIGADVWIMFEGGNSSDPVWMGGFWSSTSMPPASPAVPTMRVFQCDGLTATITDLPGAAMLEIKTATGAKITMGPTGIEIDNGMGAKIAMTGPQVSVNNGALEVI